MNFLFLTDEYFPNFGANSLVVRAVCRQLTSWGHRVYVLPAGYDAVLPNREDYEGVTVVRELPVDSKHTMVEAAKNLRLIKAGEIFAMLLGSRLLGTHSLWHKRKVCARDYLERFIQENDIHTVVSINCSAELSFPLLYLREKGRLPCKWLFYMLDPFESHEYYRTHNPINRLRAIQHRLMENCDAVLATELIYRDTAQWETKAILDKFRITEFPKIEEPVYTPAADDIPLVGQDLIHVVCTGTKNEAVRNSAYTLALCRNIPGAMFHFVGPGWAEKAPVKEDNLVFYPPCSYGAIRNMQRNANFLLNIGNIVENQLPSKVLEYITTGKPVINVYKVPNCPAKALLADWDALNLSETEPLELQRKRLQDFLMAEHAAVTFETIESIYRQYTPQAVAENFALQGRCCEGSSNGE